MKKKILFQRLINRNRPLPAITRHRIRSLALEMALDLLREFHALSPISELGRPLPPNQDAALPF